MEGAEVSSKLFINPVSVHSHPRYKGRPTDAPAVAEMAYDCAACGNIITAAPESKPAKCPKCGGQNTLIRRRPKV